MEKKWILLPQEIQKSESFCKLLTVDISVCQLLTQRGIENTDQLRSYLNPSLDNLHNPWLMKDMHKAVARIEKAIVSNEKILIYGDYDVDGTTAVASFYQFISKIHESCNIDFYIPHRYREGYGVSRAGIDYASQNNFKLIISLDCGIKSVELIDYASTLGIDFIICDHHQPGDKLPSALAILNPKQSDCVYPYKDLCGCGVGFKLMSALADHFNMPEETYLEYLDLLAIAIAADIVPMTGENRILAFHGLKKINTNPSLGIATIIKQSGVSSEMNISNVVFMIAPKVNAAGRMDDAKKAVYLFIEKNEKKASLLGEELQTDNSERKEKDAETTAEALLMINENTALCNGCACVVYHENWHKGVVGIVASRIIEHHYRPTIVLTQNEGIVTGSARSIKGLNLYEAIYACKDHLLAFGGHFAAAGLSLVPEKLIDFSKRFEEVVADMVTEEMLIPKLEADLLIGFDKINNRLFQLLEKMEPFGPENMKPVFWTKNVKDNGNSRLLKEKHIKFEITQNGRYMTGIGFNMSDKFSLVKSGNELEILYHLEENSFNGRTHLQLKIIDCRAM